MRILLTENIKEVVKSLENKVDVIERQTAVEMWRAMSILEAAIKQNIRVRSGLKVRSGTLLNSIQKHVNTAGNVVTGTIGPENVPYAKIQEDGGIIPAHRIEPRHTKALRFMGGNGQFWFSKGHMVPNITIKPKYYMKMALEEKAETIRENFRLFIIKTMETNNE